MIVLLWLKNMLVIGFEVTKVHRMNSRVIGWGSLIYKMGKK